MCEGPSKVGMRGWAREGMRLERAWGVVHGGTEAVRCEGAVLSASQLWRGWGARGVGDWGVRRDRSNRREGTGVMGQRQDPSKLIAEAGGGAMEQGCA